MSNRRKLKRGPLTFPPNYGGFFTGDVTELKPEQVIKQATQLTAMRSEAGRLPKPDRLRLRALKALIEAHGFLVRSQEAT